MYKIIKEIINLLKRRHNYCNYHHHKSDYSMDKMGQQHQGHHHNYYNCSNGNFDNSIYKYHNSFLIFSIINY